MTWSVHRDLSLRKYISQRKILTSDQHRTSLFQKILLKIIWFFTDITIKITAVRINVKNFTIRLRRSRQEALEQLSEITMTLRFE